MAGLDIRKCTQVIRPFKPRPFSADYCRSGHRQCGEKLRILGVTGSKLLIWEGESPASILSFSASYISISAGSVIFSAHTFVQFRVPYLSFLIENKKERRIKSNDKGQNRHPQVRGVYKKVTRKLALGKTRNVQGPADINSLNFQHRLSQKRVIRKSADFPACGGAREASEMYRLTCWQKYLSQLHRVFAPFNSHRSKEQMNNDSPPVQRHWLSNRVARTLVPAES